MDYDQIVPHVLSPTSDSGVRPMLPQSAARRLRDAIEPIATIGWWSRPAAEAAAALGLDFFGAYVWGRAAPLGSDTPPDVVVSSFGVFAPEMIRATLLAARRVTNRDQVLAARATGATIGLTDACASVDPSVVNRLGQRLMEAVRDLDGVGRTLFSGLRALPVPDDPCGRLWRAAELVREHRGDGHLAACVAAGLDPAAMNILTELWVGYPFGEYSGTRGHSAEILSSAADRLHARGWLGTDRSLTEDGRAARSEIERSTDESQCALIDHLGHECDAVIADAETVSAAILRAHLAPADPRKRAAG